MCKYSKAGLVSNHSLGAQKLGIRTSACLQIRRYHDGSCCAVLTMIIPRALHVRTVIAAYQVAQVLMALGMLGGVPRRYSMLAGTWDGVWRQDVVSAAHKDAEVQ